MIGEINKIGPGKKTGPLKHKRLAVEQKIQLLHPVQHGKLVLSCKLQIRPFIVFTQDSEGNNYRQESLTESLNPEWSVAIVAQ